MTDFLSSPPELLTEGLDWVLAWSNWAETAAKTVGLAGAARWGYAGLRYSIVWALALVIATYRWLNPAPDPLLVEVLVALDGEVQYDVRDSTLVAEPVAMIVYASKEAIYGQKHDITGYRDRGEIRQVMLWDQQITPEMLGLRGWARLQRRVHQIMARLDGERDENVRLHAEFELARQRAEALEAARRARERLRA